MFEHEHSIQEFRVDKASNDGGYNNRFSIDLQRLWTLLETDETSQKKKLCH